MRFTLEDLLIRLALVSSWGKERVLHLAYYRPHLFRLIFKIDFARSTVEHTRQHVSKNRPDVETRSDERPQEHSHAAQSDEPNCMAAWSNLSISTSMLTQLNSLPFVATSSGNFGNDCTLSINATAHLWSNDLGTSGTQLPGRMREFLRPARDLHISQSMDFMSLLVQTVIRIQIANFVHRQIFPTRLQCYNSTRLL